jgi:hypothetical protein
MKQVYHNLKDHISKLFDPTGRIGVPLTRPIMQWFYRVYSLECGDEEYQ